jgi:hypothetical protein
MFFRLSTQLIPIEVKMDWTKYLKDHWQVDAYGFAYAHQYKTKVIEKVVEYWEDKKVIDAGDQVKSFLMSLCHSLYFTGIAYVFRNKHVTGEITTFHALNPYFVVPVASSDSKGYLQYYNGGRLYDMPMLTVLDVDSVDKITLGVVGPALTEKMAKEQNV